MANLRCYDPNDAGGGMHEWYDGLPAGVQAAIDATLEDLLDETDLDNLPQFKALRGACYGLDEILVDIFGNGKYRILCFRGPDRGDVTLLFGFEKTTSGNVAYGPHCHSANWRKDGVIRDGRRAPACRFP